MLQQAKTASMSAVKRTAKSLIGWEWTKRFVYWIVLSAGTVGEGAFLVSALWVSINASVHSLVLLIVPETMTIHITELATALFVGLPECILPLAICSTIGHIRLWLYHRRDYWTLCWAILYGLPTFIFLVLSIFTIGNAMLKVDFILPLWMVVVRGLAGYGYGIVALLYWRIGIPQERDRLQKKDTLFAQLRQEKDTFIETLRQQTDAIIEALKQEMHTKLHDLAVRKETELQNLAAYKDNELSVLREKFARLERENDEHRELLQRAMAHNSELYSAVNQSADAALQAYGTTIIAWLNSLDKTVSIDAIAAATGISKRRLVGAIERKELRIRGTNKELIWTPSLREYLIKYAPKDQQRSPDTGPILRVVND